MKTYITVDGGTTNTKISIVSDRKIVDTLKISSKSRQAEYKAALKAAIAELLRKNGYTQQDICCVTVSGTMATAEYGLYPMEHLVAPVNMEMLHKYARRITLPEIADIPFVIIPGVKTPCDTLENADMMRGEETEIMGLIDPGDPASMYLLMGSHSKFVKTDDAGNIVDICTMLTGELIEAVATGTILQHAALFENSTLDREFLKKGYQYCLEKGINEAFFKVRVLKNIFQESGSAVYSFFVGAALCADVEYVRRSQVKKVVIGGNAHLKEAVAMLLEEYMEGQTLCLSKETVDNSVPIGAVKIVEWEESFRKE